MHVAEVSGIGSVLMAAGALLLAFACYGVAFTFAELHWGYAKNHLFYAWLAFVLTVVGSYLVVSGLPLLLAWCALSIAMALLGARYKRPSLYYQSAAYAVVAAMLAAEVFGGLFTFAFEVFTSPADRSWSGSTISGLLSVVMTAVFAYVVLAGSKSDPEHPWRFRIPKAIVALVGALGGGALLVLLIARALGSQPPEADAAVVAAVRTGVVASAAVALAALSRIPPCADLRWLVYPLLLFGFLKLALEDLPNGRPTTLFVAFAFYGVALILAPPLARSSQHHGKVPAEQGKT